MMIRREFYQLLEAVSNDSDLYSIFLAGYDNELLISKEGHDFLTAFSLILEYEFETRPQFTIKQCHFQNDFEQTRYNSFS